MFTILLASILSFVDPTVGLVDRTLTVTGADVVRVTPAPEGYEGGADLFDGWLASDRGAPITFTLTRGQVYSVRGLTAAEDPLSPNRSYFVEQMTVAPLSREQDIMGRLEKAQQAYIAYRLAMGELQDLRPTDAEIEAALQTIAAREAQVP